MGDLQGDGEIRKGKSNKPYFFFKPRCKLKQNTIAQSVPAVKCESELFEFLSSS